MTGVFINEEAGLNGVSFTVGKDLKAPNRLFGSRMWVPTRVNQSERDNEVLRFFLFLFFSVSTEDYLRCSKRK